MFFGYHLYFLDIRFYSCTDTIPTSVTWLLTGLCPLPSIFIFVSLLVLGFILDLAPGYYPTYIAGLQPVSSPLRGLYEVNEWNKLVINIRKFIGRFFQVK